MSVGTSKPSRKVAVYALYAVILLVFLIPLYWALVTSVKPAGELFTVPPKWFTSQPSFENYIHVLKSTGMPVAYRNSFIISSLSVAFTVALSSLAAFGFSRYWFRGKNTLLLGLIVLRMLPAVMLIIPIYNMMNGYGLLDTFWALILVHTALNIPFSVWIMKSFFDSVPKELDEAALIDGCGSFRRFAFVILPMAGSGLIAIGILTFFLSWNDFIMALVLTSSRNVRPMSMALYSFMSIQGVQWGAMMSAACLAIAIPAVLFLLFQKYFLAGVTGGSLKE
jgi:ABC-type glycerol-3-phosphate transport system permease component